MRGDPTRKGCFAKISPATDVDGGESANPLIHRTLTERPSGVVDEKDVGETPFAHPKSDPPA